MQNNRRKILHAMTISGGIITVAKLPSKWTAPVVESIVLPAHAQTSQTSGNAASSSGVVPTRCTNNAQTITNAEEVGRDDIVLIYDGDKFCDVEVGDPSEFGGIPADAMIVIDSDPDETNFLMWDFGGIGSSWEMTNSNFVTNNNSNGTYYIEVKRLSNPNVGLLLRATFTVTITGTIGNINMTVNNVSLVEL